MGARTVPEAYHIYEEAKSIFARASMRLTQWTSNSSELLPLLPEEDHVKGQCTGSAVEHYNR